MTIKVRKSQLGAYFLFKLITADILVDDDDSQFYHNYDDKTTTKMTKSQLGEKNHNYDDKITSKIAKSQLG